MKFFSLDETEFKLTRADWLRFVCWQPEVSDFVKTQNQVLSSLEENPIDSLLLSAFEFIDVNEAGASNKILEDSATAHVKKVRGYFSEISQRVSRYDQQSDAQKTVETVLRSAAHGDQMQ